jgi:antitoxin (DNA-binding transcriptional repressor) of toxin-antitoxin stability system
MSLPIAFVLTYRAGRHYSRPMQVDFQYAKKHFADLASAVDAGQEVVVERPGQCSLSITATKVPPAAKRKKPRVLGAGVGELRIPSREEWQAWDDEIINAPLTTGGEV